MNTKLIPREAVSRVSFPAQTIRLAIQTYEDVILKDVRAQPNVTMKVTENDEQWPAPRSISSYWLIREARKPHISEHRISSYYDAIFSVTVLGDR
jgi:hypothetical protein